LAKNWRSKGENEVPTKMKKLHNVLQPTKKKNNDIGEVHSRVKRNKGGGPRYFPKNGTGRGKWTIVKKTKKRKGKGEKK